MSRPTTFSRTVPPRLEALPDFRAELRNWLGETDVPKQVAEDIVLAAWEVCANAVEHPAGEVPSTVAVEAQCSPRGVRVAVRDGGTWTGKRRSRPCGYGLRLVEGLVDRMAIRRGFGGTEVVLFRGTPCR
jgi:anti-sigma regulatory factor (Ser/Thr protein kinase)